MRDCFMLSQTISGEQKAWNGSLSVAITRGYSDTSNLLHFSTQLKAVVDKVQKETVLPPHWDVATEP